MRLIKCFWNGSEIKPIMNNKNKLEQREQNKKHKSPSKQARDGRRLLKWLNIYHANKRTTKEASTQVYLCDLISNEQPTTHALSNFLGSKASNNQVTSQITGNKTILEHQRKSTSQNTGRKMIKVTQDKTLTQSPIHITQTPNKLPPINPEGIYSKIEGNLSLTRLEETANLTRSIRYSVRNLHKNGKKIIFPYPNAVDKILLKISGLPTDPTEVWRLLGRMFERRGEKLDMQELYEDLVTTHGRKAFDPGKSSSDCFYISRNP